MAKSSINFAKASSGGLHHNDRTHVPDYLLPEEFRLDNSYDLSAKEADKKMMTLYADAKESYQEHTGQKLQATSYKWEAVINLNKEHSLEDVQRLTKEIEKETGFTSVQIAIHRDEGRIEKDKQDKPFPIYNYHAHVTFFTLDKNGEQLYRRTIKASDRRNIEKDILEKNKDIKKGEAGSPERKAFNKLVNVEIKKRGLKVMDTKRLSEIQTMTAKSLGMVRGKVSVKEEAQKLGVDQDLNPTERLGHKQYKKIQQEQTKNTLAKQKDLKAEITELRSELKAQGANREDYAKLEALTKELKEQVKSKDLTIQDLKGEVNRWRNDAINHREAKTYKELYEEIKEEKKELEAKISDLKPLDAEIPKKSDKSDLTAISEVIKNTHSVGQYDKGTLLLDLDEFTKKDLSKDFAEMVKEKGEHKKPSMLNKQYTVTLEMKDLQEFMNKLEKVQEVKEKLIDTAKKLLDNIEKPLKAVKKFLHERLIKPQIHENIKEQQKEKALKNLKSKNRGMEK